MEGYVTRLLTDRDLDQMAQLQKIMLEGLPDPAWFYPSSRERMLQEINWQCVWGTFDGQVLAAYGVLIPAAIEPGESYAARLGEAELGAWDFQDIVVRPEYRRQGLHAMYLKMFFNHAKAHGGNRIYATVDPNNGSSWRNFQRAGYVRVDVRPAYDGRLRAYYRKEI